MQALSEDSINILAVFSSGYVSCLWSLSDGSQSNIRALRDFIRAVLHAGWFQITTIRERLITESQMNACFECLFSGNPARYGLEMESESRLLMV